MKLIREKAGVISSVPIWIFFDSCWMYEDESLLRLFWKVITEWRHDRHIIG